MKSTNPKNANKAEEAFRVSEFDYHDSPQAVFEHGRLFINCNCCGAQWSVTDEEPGIDGFGFEEISHGDDHCLNKGRE